MKTFRALLLAASSMLLLQTADLQAQSRWSGPYAGLHLGAAWSGFTNLDTDPPNVNCWWCDVQYGDNMSGLFAGGTLGYNVVFGTVLIGVEGEISITSLDGNANDPVNLVPYTEVSGRYFGAITGRAGMVFGQFLPYVKIGWGFMKADIDWTDTDYSAFAHSGVTLSGLVFGGGLEYAISGTMSVKIEYLRFEVGHTDLLDVQNYCCGYQQMVRIDDVDTVKVGLNIRLGQ